MTPTMHLKCWIFPKQLHANFIRIRLNLVLILSYLMSCLTWALARQNLSSRFPTKRDSKPETSRNIEILLEVGLEMVLSSKRITKALTSLRRCAGLGLCCSQTPDQDRLVCAFAVPKPLKTGFLASRPTLCRNRCKA